MTSKTNEAPYRGPRHDAQAHPAHRPVDPHRTMPTGERPQASAFHRDNRGGNVSK
jgi:hypothetical protein